MQSPRSDDIDWSSLTSDHEVVLVPPSIAGLATAVLLHRSLDDPFYALVDPLDLASALSGLVRRGTPPSRLIVAGLSVDPADLDAIGSAMGLLRSTAIDWYDDHAWSPDAQAAIWTVCRRAEIGPDVPAPVHYAAHQILDRAPLGLRMIDLVENGTGSADPWVRSRFRWLAGVIPPERGNLVPDAIASTAAEPADLSEVEWEIVAEQEIAEKTIERLVREELDVAAGRTGTRVLLADLGEWSASPYLSLACRRFFTYQILVRVEETGRITIEKEPSYTRDLSSLRNLPAITGPGTRLRSTRRSVVIDVDPARLPAAVEAILVAV